MKCPRCAAEFEDQDRCPECGCFQPGNKQRVQKGNTLARIHGVGSTERVIAQRRQELNDLNAELAGSLGSEPRFAYARALTANALARYRIYGEWLERNGYQDDKGRPYAVAKAYAEAENAVSVMLDKLGMWPSSAARLGLNLAKRELTLAEKVAAERK